MKLSELIETLTIEMKANGDRDVVIVAEYEPDEDSPCGYSDLFNITGLSECLGSGMNHVGIDCEPSTARPSSMWKVA